MVQADRPEEEEEIERPPNTCHLVRVSDFMSSLHPCICALSTVPCVRGSKLDASSMPPCTLHSSLGAFVPGQVSETGHVAQMYGCKWFTLHR